MLKYSKFSLLLSFSVFSITCSVAQQGDPFFRLEAMTGYSTPGRVPFWFRADRFGSVPLDNLSAGLTVSMLKEYRMKHLINWGAGFEGRVNAGNDLNFILPEGYVKMRISLLELSAGRRKEMTGICDTLLSSGSFSISGNAPGIPQVKIATTDYVILPFFGKIFAVKGSYSHGWLGRTMTRLDGNARTDDTYFHHKSLYGRIGKPNWKLKLYGGVNHQVFWGNEKNIFGKDFNLTPLRTYLYVVTGKGYSNSTIEPSRIGNHLGSIDISTTYDFKKVRLFLYRQNFYDFIAFRYLANISDGLNGLSIINRSEKKNNLRLDRFLLEFLYSMDQGVYVPDKPAYNSENYYNNYVYSAGWSYMGAALGNPLLTTSDMMRTELTDHRNDHFPNNRIKAIHMGLEFSFSKWTVITKGTYSKNYGTYYYPFKKPVGQFSFYLECFKHLENGMNFGFRTALDRGNLLYNSGGLQLCFSMPFR